MLSNIKNNSSYLSKKSINKYKNTGFHFVKIVSSASVQENEKANG